MQTVTLLHAPLRAGSAWPWQQALLRALPYAKRLELERRDEAALHAALGGLALWILGSQRLRHAAAPVQQLVFEPGRKPRSPGGPFFSISHAEGRVACAVSVDVDPGVDIEFLPDSASAGQREKLRRWTATEAVLKTAGLGLRGVGQVVLGSDLSSAVIGARRYVLVEAPVAEDYVCHVAAADATPTLHISEVHLAEPATSRTLERSLGLAPHAE